MLFLFPLPKIFCTFGVCVCVLGPSICVSDVLFAFPRQRNEFSLYFPHFNLPEKWNTVGEIYRKRWDEEEVHCTLIPSFLLWQVF